jgi:hypothetical protein
LNKTKPRHHWAGSVFKELTVFTTQRVLGTFPQEISHHHAGHGCRARSSSQRSQEARSFRTGGLPFRNRAVFKKYHLLQGLLSEGVLRSFDLIYLDSQSGGLLIRLKEGDVTNYEASRKTAWAWILKYPMHNDRWSGYFEDVEAHTTNLNQANPTMTAYYILSQPDPGSVDPQWIGDVGHLIDWVRKHYGRGPYFGAWAIDEQGPPPEYVGCCSRAGLASDTSRWAAINALYYELTNDGQAQVDAFRSLSYSTYFAADDGKIVCCGLDYNAASNNDSAYWYDDGYGDYIRNIMWALGAIPTFAPQHQDHLLRSSSVVQAVQYGKHSIQYRTFDSAATEVLRLTYKPAQVQAGGTPISLRTDLKEPGYTITALPGGDYVVRVRHTSSGDIQVKG